ncbi:MAG: class I SAM-dependent methyltransferase [Rhodobiaceae bacterium]|nr:class I SAM-dependent methyltransferase [Rhodobiaceae bacterium]
MLRPLARPIARLRYAAEQGARVAWYAGHYAAVNRLRGPVTRPGEVPFKPTAPIPKLPDIMNSIRELFERDYQNIEAGVYKAPEVGTDPRKPIDKAIRFFLDAKKVDERRMDRRHSEVNTGSKAREFPRYYLQNFHFQTDGWLSEDSANLYDTQVETLFAGTADAMRRQALVPIAEYLSDKDQRDVSLLDIACGTGRFLREVKRNWPRTGVTALDLSPDYLGKTKRALSKWGRVKFINAPAERMPLEKSSQDIVTATYLFHELPPKIRMQVAAEIARVLKPGGLFVLVDALQTDDQPSFNSLLEFFPVAFHEPYFSTYLEEDFEALFARVGLRPVQGQTGYLTKMEVFERV